MLLYLRTLFSCAPVEEEFCNATAFLIWKRTVLLEVKPFIEKTNVEGTFYSKFVKDMDIEHFSVYNFTPCEKTER